MKENPEKSVPAKTQHHIRGLEHETETGMARIPGHSRRRHSHIVTQRSRQKMLPMCVGIIYIPAFNKNI